MEVKGIDYAKLNEAVEKFGSLKKVNAQLEIDNLVLEKKNALLKKEGEKLITTKNSLTGHVEDMSGKVKSNQEQLQLLSIQLKEHSYQYELFCGFMTMVTESPSVTDSINTLVASFQKLKEPGWYLPKNADEMRSLFIRTVMGDYLKSFRCDSCGAKFITNKKPKKTLLGADNTCPACHEWYAVKPDNSFLKAMVSQQQLENTYHLDKVLGIYETLLPFEAFLNAPCEICHKPVGEWDEYNVKLAIQGTGLGHTSCWKSDVGKVIELKKALEKVNKP